MDEKIEKLKEWIDGSDNIVFFGGAGVRRKAESLISEARTAFTIRSMPIRRRPS